MNRRSAMTLAAGVVLALLVGGIALSALGGPAPATAIPDVRPRVRTIERTITVHRRQPDTGATATVAADGAVATLGSPAVGDDDEALEERLEEREEALEERADALEDRLDEREDAIEDRLDEREDREDDD